MTGLLGGVTSLPEGETGLPGGVASLPEGETGLPGGVASLPGGETGLSGGVTRLFIMMGVPAGWPDTGGCRPKLGNTGYG